jgi:hypothetical protein
VALPVTIMSEFLRQLIYNDAGDVVADVADTVKEILASTKNEHDDPPNTATHPDYKK